MHDALRRSDGRGHDGRRLTPRSPHIKRTCAFIPTVCLGCGETFEARRRNQTCCSAPCRAKAAKDRRTARLLGAALAVADYLPAAGQAAYDKLLAEIVS